MTAALAAAAALAFITGSAIYFRRHPIWHGYEPAHAPGGRPSPRPAAGPARRDWGESRLPSAAERTAQFAAIAVGQRVMPGRADGIPHADADQFLPPWEDAAEPVTPEPPLPPLPGYLPAPSVPHAAPDVRGRVHDGCEISDTGQQAALTALSERYDCTDLSPSGEFMCSLAAGHGGPHADRTRGGTVIWDDDPPDWSESDQAVCLCGKVPGIPGEPITSEADCPAHGTELPPAGAAGLGTRPGEDDCTTACLRWSSGECDGIAPCLARIAVAARENAAARWHLKAHVGYVMKRKPPLREYVEATIGPGVADLNPAYERDAAAITVPPAEDFDSLLATARAVSDGG